LRPNSPVPFMRMAGVHVIAKDPAAAMQDLKKALALKPDLIDAQRALIKLHLDAGGVADAVTVARDVQKQRPKEPIGYILEGEIHVSRPAWSEAVAAYRNGLKQVASTDLAVRIDVALRADGRTADAEKFVAAWLRDHPKDARFRSYLAETAIGKRDFAGAAAQYKAVLEIEPRSAVAFNNLAYAAGQLKDPKALEYAEKADKLAPNNAAFLDTLGALLVENGDIKRGVQTLQRAAELAPSDAGIRLNLARALIKDGQKDAAKKELDGLAKLGDKFSGQAEVAKLMQGL
jgi:putative PEP-CTERM system TPR-repeat lipoprotein